MFVLLLIFLSDDYLLTLEWQNIIGISYPKFLPTRILKKTFSKIMKSLPECEIIENNFQINHLHPVTLWR